MPAGVILQLDHAAFLNRAIDRQAWSPALEAVRVFYRNVIDRQAMAVGQLELGPGSRDAGVQRQAVAFEVEPEDRLQTDLIHPACRAGVPGPAAAADVR